VKVVKVALFTSRHLSANLKGGEIKDARRKDGGTNFTLEIGTCTLPNPPKLMTI
jgi:hypothetical protein